MYKYDDGSPRMKLIAGLTLVGSREYPMLDAHAYRLRNCAPAENPASVITSTELNALRLKKCSTKLSIISNEDENLDGCGELLAPEVDMIYYSIS
jgi:hypothetical protein